MKKYSCFLFFLIVLALSSCGRNSLEDFRSEGEEITRSLIQEFRKIRTRSQLLNASPKLKRLFNDLVDVMIAAHEFRHKQANLDKNFVSYNSELSNQLRLELNRIYKIEGGRQIIEKCEEQALHRLDAYEKNDHFNTRRKERT
jgi:hypothetical protein